MVEMMRIYEEEEGEIILWWRGREALKHPQQQIKEVICRGHESEGTEGRSEEEEL